MPAAWVGAIASVAGSALSSSATGDAARAQSAGAGRAIEETAREYDQSRKDLAPYRAAGGAAIGRLRTLLGIGDTTGASWEPGLPTPTGADDLSTWAQKAGYDLPQGRDWNAGEEANLLKGYRAYLAGVAPTSTGGTVDPETGSLLRKFSMADRDADPVYQSGLQFGLDEGTKAIERRAAASGGLDSGATLKALTRFGSDYGSTKAGDSYSRYVSDQDRTYGKLSGIAGLGSGATNVGVSAGQNTASNLSSIYTGLGNAQGAAAIAGGNLLGSGIANAGNLYQQNQLLRQLSGGGARTLPGSTGGGGGEIDV